MRTMRYWRVIVYGLFALCRLSGTVVIQPSFGQLLIYTDRIVFTSVDGKSLIGIDKDGNQKWELQFPQQIYENRWNDKFLLVQSGREVFQVDVQQGARSRLVMMPEFQFLIAHGDDHSFLAAFDSASIITALRFSIHPNTP